MTGITKNQIRWLEDKARWLRQQTVKYSFGVPHHLGGSLSCIEILIGLYYGLKSDESGNDIGQTKFVLSKGHACIPLYIVLADLQMIEAAELEKMMSMGGRLLGHPCRSTTNGIDVSTGSLGQGLSFAIGMGLGARASRQDARICALLGDSELQSGQVWEALLFLSQHKLANVRAVIDFNKFQADGSLHEIVSIDPLANKLRSLGLQVSECDGHDISQIIRFFRCDVVDRPAVLIAHTTKGKGVSFMEHDNAWHSGTLSPELYRKAMEELSVPSVDQRVFAIDAVESPVAENQGSR